MAEFKDLLYKALRDGKDVYDAFVSCARMNLPPDSDSRYKRLRGEGKFVCQDEADVNVYVNKVANRHIPKFTWLYGKLFEKFSADFSGEIDIVVWGCGCGLDLLALYDVAQKQKNPHLWLNVRNITLLDKSESALKRAKDVAEVLFPMAHGKVMDTACDFTKPETVPEKLIVPESLLPVPRVHLISNIVDLFPDEQQVKVFALTIKERSCRKYRRSGETKCYYNEIFVAFSPEYKTEEGVLQSQRFCVFRDEWDKNYASEFVDDSGPDRCTYAAFTYRTLKKDNLGNKLLRSISHQMKGEQDKDNLLGIIAALARFFVERTPVLRVYEWADLQYWKDDLKRVVLVAKAASNVCPCVINIRKSCDDDEKNRERTMKSLLEKCGNSYEDKKVWGQSLRMLAWDSEKGKLYSGSGDKSSEVTQAWFDCCVASPNDKMDFEQFFVINPKGAKPLPPLDSMDEKQKGLVCSRRQKSKVRGGAGCGKTTAMLWHGVLAILRTRMPVLMACKTVTLFNHNKRRMAATLLKEVPGLEYVDRNLICFRTVDDVLCKHTKNTIDCEIRKCGRCKRSFLANRGRFSRSDCEKDSSKASTCEILLHEKNHAVDIGSDLSENEKKKRCEACKGKIVSELSRKGSKYEKDAEPFGAVLVDEIQSVEPKKVQALFNLSAAANPWREFYVFCDERQSLQSGSLERDDSVGKLRVKVPYRGDGFGNWVTLSEPYRQTFEFSGKLALVSADMQCLTNDKYGESETANVPYQESLMQGVFKVCLVSNDWRKNIFSLIDDLKNVGATRITVVCDRPDAVRELLADPRARWNSTYRREPSFREEQRLRGEFEEQEEVTNLTTIELAQGWDFESIILVVTESDSMKNVKEKVLTGVTRATKYLRILDCSSNHWVYNRLKRFN